MIPILKRGWNFTGSRDLSVFIFIMGLTYFLFLAIFGAIIPVWWVNNISKLLPFKVLYILFFINLLICEIKWMPVVVRRCRRPKPPETAQDWQRFGHGLVVSGQWPVASGQSENREDEKMGRCEDVNSQPLNFSTAQLLNSVLLAPHSSLLLHAYRGRFSPIGNLLFHLSFLFIAAGVFVNMFYRFDAKVLLMEGQEFAGFTAEYGRNAPDVKFILNNIRPEFWKEKLLFTDLVAGIKYNGREDEVRISKAVNINGANVTVQGISYTPKYILREMGGRELDIGYVNLANLAPGTVDHFQIPSYPYKIYVSIYPDFEIKEGKVGTKSMNLANPTYLLRVVRNKVSVFTGIMGLKDEAYFDGLALSFPEIKYNGTFQIVKAPGNFLIWSGFILMGVGLIWRLMLYRREVVARMEGDAVHLYVNCDHYSRLFMDRCQAELR